MDHQQATIFTMTETAKENSRVHIEMHNQIVVLQAEVARLKVVESKPLELINALNDANTRIAELEAAIRQAPDLELTKKGIEYAATEAALRWGYLHPVDSANNDIDTFVRMGSKALLGEGK